MHNRDVAAIKICDLEAYPQHHETVSKWILDEWGDLSREDISHALVPDPTCPPNLMALAEEEPVGFLTYKRFPVDEGEEVPAWINSLYIDSAWRGRGIGTRLLKQGQRQAAEHGCNKLYVYTEIPAYYQGHEWTLYKDAKKPEFKILRLLLQ